MNNNILLTDLYELTMLQAYAEHRMSATAVFEFFVRKLPRQRNFLVAAGLEPVVSYLETLSFTREDLEWLAGDGHLSREFIATLDLPPDARETLLTLTPDGYTGLAARQVDELLTQCAALDKQSIR